MHGKSNKEANLAAKQYLVEGMLAKEDTIEDDQRPVHQCKYHAQYELYWIFASRFSVQVRQVILRPLRCEKMVKKYEKHHVSSL